LLSWVDTETVAADDWPPRFIQIAGVGGSVALSGQTIDPDADPTVTLGRTIFTQRCASCHSTSSTVVIVGPSLAGIPERAAERVDGQSAQEYLRISILNPSDYVVEGFADVMQKNFADVISSRELDALIAYLMTLEG
jgi:cytochrome c2